MDPTDPAPESKSWICNRWHTYTAISKDWTPKKCTVLSVRTVNNLHFLYLDFATEVVGEVGVKMF
jgi:hypothetical protein